MSVEKEIIEILEGPTDYSRALSFDQKCDLKYGLIIEEKKGQGSNSEDDYYWGLTKEALLTSYLDYYQILKSLDPGDTLVDLGSGYSRGSFLSCDLGVSRCIGLEYSSKRVELSKNSFCSFFEKKYAPDIRCHDLYSDSLPSAKAYYFYFPKGRVFNQVLGDILRLRREVLLYICESHGDVIPFFEKLNLGDKAGELSLSLPRHRNSIIYYSIPIFDVEIISYENSFPLWFLLHQKENLVVVVNYKGRDWALKIGSIDLIVYQDCWALQNLVTNRIVLIEKDEYIKSVILFKNIDQNIQNLLNSSIYGKVFLDSKGAQAEFR